MHVGFFGGGFHGLGANQEDVFLLLGGGAEHEEGVAEGHGGFGFGGWAKDQEAVEGDVGAKIQLKIFFGAFVFDFAGVDVAGGDEALAQGADHGAEADANVAGLAGGGAELNAENIVALFEAA